MKHFTIYSAYMCAEVHMTTWRAGKCDDIHLDDSYGPRLKAIRKARGMDQHEFARELGCTQAMVSMMESGRRPRAARRYVNLLKS